MDGTGEYYEMSFPQLYMLYGKREIILGGPASIRKEIPLKAEHFLRVVTEEKNRET